MTDQHREREATADKRDAAAHLREDAADRRDDGAAVRENEVTVRESSSAQALVWLFCIIAVVGVALTIVMIRASAVDDRQAKATEELVVATQDVADLSHKALDALVIGRYERTKFQIDQRKLVCLDLQDGDTGATDEQIAECAADYIRLPPKPEGYGR